MREHRIEIGAHLRRRHQAITVAGTGCSAALDAERYLAALADLENQTVAIPA